MILSLLFSFFVLTLLVPKDVFANQNSSYASVINPVRISPNNPNPLESLKAEYKVVEDVDLPATWLITYDVLENADMVSEISTFGKEHEIGIFLEVGEELCETAGVTYDKSYSWHHAANVFLTGYSQQDRLKLIDTVFDEFKLVFGYYPKSVGAWWIDAYSLSYMYDKYGVTGNLGLADQYVTDGYRVWGTYWAEPFYPSKINSGIPGEGNNRSGAVTVQWAPRDPLNGYFDSYYSTQDYLQVKEGLDTTYFEKLTDLYGNKHRNRFGHVVVGLESDLNYDAYEGEYKNQMETVRKKADRGELKVINLSDFATWYKETFPDRSPSYLVESSDLLGKNLKTFWYTSTKYRIGIAYNEGTQNLEIFDLRVYPDNFYEPYYYSPNVDFRLLVQTPSVIDRQSLDNSWNFNLGERLNENYSDSSIELVFREGSIVLSEDAIRISGVEDAPYEIKDNSLVDVAVTRNVISTKPSVSFEVGGEGYVFNYLNLSTRNFLKSKKGLLLVFVLVMVCFSSIFFMVVKRFRSIGFLLILALATLVYFGFKDKFDRYYVSQSEVEALDKLKSFEKGSVLVYDHFCFGCDWNTQNKPAVYDNLRGYMEKLSGKDVVYNKTVFEAKDQKSAKEAFDKSRAMYIYVTNYEGQIEKVPFSPGDLGIELVYENANAKIWKKIR